jgi:hypothetical protein
VQRSSAFSLRRAQPLHPLPPRRPRSTWPARAMLSAESQRTYCRFAATRIATRNPRSRGPRVGRTPIIQHFGARNAALYAAFAFAERIANSLPRNTLAPGESMHCTRKHCVQCWNSGKGIIPLRRSGHLLKSEHDGDGKLARAADRGAVNPIASRAGQRCAEDDRAELNVPIQHERRSRSRPRLEDDPVGVHLVARDVA